jgi:hypothetical protein
MRNIALAAALAASLTGPALAKDQCYDYTTTMEEGNLGTYNQTLNMVKTDQWREYQQLADPKAMSAFAGVWYTEHLSPAGDMLNQQYLSFEPNGLFQYQDRTCATQPGITPCSQNQGVGDWNAHPLPDGSLTVMYHFSDLNRGSACADFAGSIQGAVFSVQGGGQLQRVQ